MQRVPIPLVGQTGTARSRVVNAQRSVNLYTEYGEVEGKKVPVALYGTPGLKLAGEFAIAGGVRSNGIEFEFDGYAYFVIYNRLVRVLPSGGIEIVGGELNTRTGRVSMAASPTDLVIVDGQDGWIWDGTTMTQIVDANFVLLGATHVTWNDFYFIATKAGTGQFWVSDLDDPAVWNALAFRTAEKHPDVALAVHANLRELWVFGTKTTELYYDSGDPDFPYERVAGGVFEYGLQAAWSVAAAAGAWLFLARNSQGTNVFVLATSSGSQRVSTKEIETELEQMERTDDAFAFTYHQAGHTFYQVTFPSADKTLVYDITEGEWHERKCSGQGSHRAGGHVFAAGRHLIGDRTSGKIFEYDLETYTDDGETIERIRETAFVHASGRNISIAKLLVEFEQGVGTLTGQGRDPQAMLQYSVDNGKTWSYELWAPIGRSGQYDFCTEWNRLGQGRNWQFRVTVTDPVFVGMLRAYAELEVRNA